MQPGASSGGAVARPRVAVALGREQKEARFALFGLGLGALGLGVYACHAIWVACGARPGVPLDDTYIHFQFARAFARGAPFEYVPGEAPVAGATSLLWPLVLAAPSALGAGGAGLIVFSWIVGFGSLLGQAYETYVLGRRFLDRAFALSAGALVLVLAGNVWFAASGMETVPLGYALLRTVRRAAEFSEGRRGSARAFELCVLAVVCATLRPEGALGALLAAGVLGAFGHGRTRWLGLCGLAPLLPAFVAWLFTGHAEQTTAIVKWLPLNPYYRGHVGQVVLAQMKLVLGTLLNGEAWAHGFVPEGFAGLAWLALPALCGLALLRRAPSYAAFCLLLALGVLLPTTYETLLVNRLRYLWPFAAPWLLGVSALGGALGAALGQVHVKLRALGLLVPGAALVGLLRLLPGAVEDVATSAWAISSQQVSLGVWAKQSLPKAARLGVNDTGAITFFSDRSTFDVVGLTTEGEAQHWVAGPGSRFEHYEHLPPAALPTHFLVYPSWFAIPGLLGRELTRREVHGATILGGPTMVACEADYSALGSGATPAVPQSSPLLDVLDVADLESEAAHGYELLDANVTTNVVIHHAARTDGGRSLRTHERFLLRFEAGGVLGLRVGSTEAAEMKLVVAGSPPLAVRLRALEWQELYVQLPTASPERRPHPRLVELWSPVPFTSLHYWSYAKKSSSSR